MRLLGNQHIETEKNKDTKNIVIMDHQSLHLSTHFDRQSLYKTFILTDSSWFKVIRSPNFDGYAQKWD